jgi:putative ABC transport system permease protein
LGSFSWQELRHHPWRNAAAVVSVMLGVALAFSVHLINASALNEFAQAARSVGGQADLELRSNAANGLFDEAVLARLQSHPQVASASPVLESSSYALDGAGPAQQGPQQGPQHDAQHAARPPDAAAQPRGLGTQAQGVAPPAQAATPSPADGATQRTPLRLLGVDVLRVAAIAPDLLPLPDAGQSRLAVFAPDALFLNASARAALPGATVRLQRGLQLQSMQVAGSVRAAGAPLAVMDIAALQDFLGQVGQLSRVDLRLQPGVDRSALARELQASPGWPKDVQLVQPGDAPQRINDLSRAYRVNLTVLALVALFTGAFLVYSVLALSVARRAQQFALLGVLGLTGRQRLALVVLEAGALGAVGSGLGLLLGTGLADLALHFLGGDLGGGYFRGVGVALRWDAGAAAGFAALGVAAALLGAWWPARSAQRLPPAQTLKGLDGVQGAGTGAARWGFGLLALGGLLALLPPVGGVPLAAYLSVAALLLGGIAALPWWVGLLLDRLAPHVQHRALWLLPIERARRVRASAAIAVSGVVAALSLAVALTVMVASFRGSVMQWLDAMLPASLYVRTASSAGAMETAFFDPAFVTAAARLPGVERLSSQRVMALALDTAKPAVTLLARPLREPGTGALGLPLVAQALPAPRGTVAIYVSEAMVDLYGAQVGTEFAPLQTALASASGVPRFFVAGVWRDYARQFGTIAIDQSDFASWSKDGRVNDLALWLAPQAEASAVEGALRALANTLADTPGGGADQLLEFGSAQQIRRISLQIFDRSFAVTYWLQAVAIGIGLFGVAASFSAQVLARRKEFGLLVHLGLTRRQILGVVAAEGAVWSALGALAGLALGLAVAVVLVHVVNPQSFHWTMDLAVPWARLLALAGAVLVAGTLTAWLAGRAAAGRDAVLAVKEDW